MADALDPACPFCRMVLGTEPCHRVAEDADTLAFLSRRPINPGHVLVVPKRHVPDFEDLDEAGFLRLMAAVRRLAPAVRAATRPVKVGVVIAGFDVPHTHVHLIPLHDYHDVTSRAFAAGPAPEAGDAALAALAARLRAGG